MYGTLCHVCYPELHTYIVVYQDGETKKYTAAGTDQAISLANKYLRGRSISKISITCEVYRRIYPNKKPEVEKDADMDEDDE